MKTSEASTTADDPVTTVFTWRSFPLRTLMVCFTIWLVATEALIFDQIKFNTRIELLEQATRALRGPEVITPTQRTRDFPGGGKVEKL
jgi:hypothetical protein